MLNVCVKHILHFLPTKTEFNLFSKEEKKGKNGIVNWDSKFGFRYVDWCTTDIKPHVDFFSKCKLCVCVCVVGRGGIYIISKFNYHWRYSSKRATSSTSKRVVIKEIVKTLYL